jgi:ATP-dependent Lon protease
MTVSRFPGGTPSTPAGASTSQQIPAGPRSMTPPSTELEDLRSLLGTANLPEAARTAAGAELRRIARMSPDGSDAHASIAYVRWLIHLPWGEPQTAPVDLTKARSILDRNHHGLEEVKERILEFLAVAGPGGGTPGPAICLAGPPGVGKSTLARSIAEAAGRPFVQMSVAGMNDEAEIMGRRRGQPAAAPGKVLQALHAARSRGPVFMVDELDRLDRADGAGTASALVEVLDRDLNGAFRDLYLDVPFDLSSVFFVTTANVVFDVPRSLRDRVEVISIPGYTRDEKLAIAREHLLPRALRAAGLPGLETTFTEDALLGVIRGYTLEAGVRGLERVLARVGRRLALLRALGKPVPAPIGADDLTALLGPPLYEDSVLSRDPAVGIAAGLAWTADGGVVQLIEVSSMAGAGRIVVTGRLGDVMRESADLAYSWARANAAALGFKDEDVRDLDLHVHAPEGGVRKDGPSTGVALAAAIVSVFTRRPVRADVAMTGELTLRGRVLDVGGVREKVSAAHRAGIRHILFPMGNRRAVEALSPDLKKDMRFDFLEHVYQYLDLALLPPTTEAPGPV